MADWPTDHTLGLLNQRLQSVGEQNLARIPVAMALEADEEGDLYWTVDIMVRTNDYELESTATHPDLRTAAKNAYVRFCRSHTYYLHTGQLPE